MKWSSGCAAMHACARCHTNTKTGCFLGSGTGFILWLGSGGNMQETIPELGIAGRCLLAVVGYSRNYFTISKEGKNPVQSADSPGPQNQLYDSAGWDDHVPNVSHLLLLFFCHTSSKQAAFDLWQCLGENTYPI